MKCCDHFHCKRIALQRHYSEIGHCPRDWCRPIGSRQDQVQPDPDHGEVVVDRYDDAAEFEWLSTEDWHHDVIRPLQTDVCDLGLQDVNYGESGQHWQWRLWHIRSRGNHRCKPS